MQLKDCWIFAAMHKQLDNVECRLGKRKNNNNKDNNINLSLENLSFKQNQIKEIERNVVI